MKPSVLIATPCYAGQITNAYYLSMMRLVVELLREGIPYGILTIPTDSLISRARNRCAQVALAQKVDKLFFIDADQGFEPHQFLSVYNSEKLVVGGTTPMKQADIRLVYNPLPQHILELEGEAKYLAPRSPEELKVLGIRFGNEAGEVEMRHVGTGFMCIATRALEQLKDWVQEYEQPDTIDHTKNTKYWNFFPSGPKDGQFESEDWGFCSLVRDKLHGSVWLNTKVVIAHQGQFTFKV